MLARSPLPPVHSRPAPIVRMKRDRKRVLMDRIVDIMREVEPTAFAAEGPCSAGIRSALCLEGWRWRAADAVADEIVMGALNIVRAKRPDWYEGQPDWTRPGALPIERETCAECHRKLPTDRFKFCCDECNFKYNGARRRQAMAEAIENQRKAYRAAWSGRQPPRVCQNCGSTYQPKTPQQRFCRPECNAFRFG